MPLLQEKVTASPSSCDTLTTLRIYLTPTNTDSTRSPYFDSVKLNGPNSGKLTGSLIYILLHEPNHGSTRGLGVFRSPPFKFYLARTRDNDDRGNCTVFSVGVVLSKSCTFPHLPSKQILCRHLRLLETENTLTPFRNCRLSYMAPPSSVELPRQAGGISNIFGWNIPLFVFCFFALRKNRQREVIRVPAISNKVADIPADDFSWRKYGQKPIKGSPYPRWGISFILISTDWLRRSIGGTMLWVLLIIPFPFWVLQGILQVQYGEGMPGQEARGAGSWRSGHADRDLRRRAPSLPGGFPGDRRRACVQFLGMSKSRRGDLGVERKREINHVGQFVV